MQRKPRVCVMPRDSGKLGFACGAGSSLLALPPVPPRVVFAPLLTAWLGYSSMCQKLCLLSGCQNASGEQSLRKELFYRDLIELSVRCSTLWVVEMSFFLCFAGKQQPAPTFPRLSDLEVSVASLAEQNVFFNIKLYFSFPLWCKKCGWAGGHFSGLPSPSDGKIIRLCCQ